MVPVLQWHHLHNNKCTRELGQLILNFSGPVRFLVRARGLAKLWKNPYSLIRLSISFPR